MSFFVTHLTLAQTVFDGFKSDVKASEFFLGVSFPDIRYLGVIERSRTHAIQKANSDFTVGMQGHVALDNFRFAFLKERLPELLDPIKDMAIKLVEETVFYKQNADWSRQIAYLDKIIDEELSWVNNPSALKKWHSMIQKYLLVGPNLKSIEELATEMGIDQDIFTKVAEYFLEFQDDKRIKREIIHLQEEGSHSGYCISLEN